MGPSRDILLFNKNSGYILDDYKSDGSYGRYSSVDDKMEYLHFTVVILNLVLEGVD